MKSQSQHVFSQVPAAEIQRSSFDRSNNLKTTFDAGPLVPIFCDEVLPGDTFSLNMSAFARLATPIFPIMDNMFLETFFFFVPNRLVWDNWNKFNGEQEDPGDSTDFLIPQLPITAGQASLGSVFDYFGLPINEASTFSALPFRAYNLIYNEWFRDENLIDSKIVIKADGPDTITPYALWSRGKRHDYFTSALPFPQKGDAVELSIGDLAPVVTDADFLDVALVGSTVLSPPNDSHSLVSTGASATYGAPGSSTPNLFADLSTATATTINEIREAFQIQRLFERDARGGTRYTEIIKAHFGVTSPDARLQRPEFLGGGSQPINITPIAQTSNDGTNGAVGQLAAMGTVNFSGHGFSKSFTEHGHIIGLLNVRADLSYQQRIDRMWSRSTRFDHYWPALAHLGEQAIISKELHYEDNFEDEIVFGFQERYAEYRFKPSSITGLFRSEAAGTLDSWHLAQHFPDVPVLNADFITENPPIDRVIKVPSEPHFILDAFFQLRCARPMPLFGVPGMMDHF